MTTEELQCRLDRLNKSKRTPFDDCVWIYIDGKLKGPADKIGLLKYQNVCKQMAEEGRYEEFCSLVKIFTKELDGEEIHIRKDGKIAETLPYYVSEFEIDLHFNLL
jgi:hypothetical protein